MNFEVYKDGQLDCKFALNGAYMFGIDGIPLRGVKRINFRKGVIDCQKRNNDAAGLCLLWPINGFGKIMLATTRLPERKKPYNLNVELARAKLMEITIKREDWSFLEDKGNHLAEAKDLFIQSLGNIHNGSIASVLADESLKKSMVFSELLAEKNAEMIIKARRKIGGYAKHSLGCVIDASRIEQIDYLNKLCKTFGFLTIPVKWSEIEKEKGDYDFSVLDKCFSAVSGRKVAVCVGPLLCFEKQSLPGWLLKSNVSFEKIREYAYNFVSEIVGRYNQKVHAWRVVSGLNALNFFGFNFEQTLEMSRAAIMAARAVDSRSLKIIEICYPWGEYYSSVSETTPPLVYLDMIMQSGINPDAIGLQLRFGKNRQGMCVRDMLAVSSLLDRFAPLTKPLHLTAVEVPGGWSDENDSNNGIWRKKWNEAVQSKWIGQFYKIVLGKSFVNTVTYSAFADSDLSELNSSGLVTEDLKDKKSFLSLDKLQKTLLSKS